MKQALLFINLIHNLFDRTLYLIVSQIIESKFMNYASDQQQALYYVILSSAIDAASRLYCMV
jgi:hypothetical protein